MSSVSLIKNIGLDDTATGVRTGTVHEPTAAAFNDELFVTGNWFASRSTDGGTTWTLVDPFTTFAPAADGFCCDQITLHERSRNLWVWLLQYSQPAGGVNVFRLAVSSSGPGGPWTYWDFSPSVFNAAWTSNVWLDYPDAATTDKHLYITYNVFDSQDQWLQALVLRAPLDGLAGGNAQFEFHTISTYGSLRLTRGATSEMFFASHLAVNPVRIFRWPDEPGATLSFFDVSVSAWNDLRPYSSKGPGGVEWLSRLDPRITAGWAAGDRVGFLWTANASSGRPQPYVKAMVADTDNKSLVAEPDIWNPDVAFAYPSACPNANGVVGVSLFFGGGQFHPSHAVGYLDGDQWVLAASRRGTHGPTDGKWGDYLSCEVHDPDGTDWVASGFTLQNGSDRRSIEPQYAQFTVGA
jgi:hypothetical protein